MSHTEVVQSIQNNVERPEPRHIELRVFDVGVDGVYLNVGIECRGSVCSNLSVLVFCECYVTLYVSDESYQSFTLLDILLAKEELAVEIRQVDGVKVQEGDVPKPGHYHILYYWASASIPTRATNGILQDTMA